jgi:hypothetical protein
MCDFFDKTKSSRAIPELPSGFLSEYSNIIERLLKQEEVDSASLSSLQIDAIERTGILIVHNSKVEFSSALTKAEFISRYSTGSNDIPFDYTLKDIVILAVKNISSQRARMHYFSTIHKQINEPYESFYRMEFYRHVIPVLNYLGIQGCAPDIGKAFGEHAKLDFYVNHNPEKKWGIEIVRDNSKVDEQFSRFSGLYHEIPMTQWVIVHFLILNSHSWRKIPQLCEKMKSK